jgi:hypothetical protein
MILTRGKPKYWDRNRSKCHFIHHESYMEWWDPGLHVENPATNRLSRDKALEEMRY